MIPLKVALIVKGSPATLKRDDKNMGYFSYAVPEFTWEHFVIDRIEPRQKFKGFDVIVIEDSSMGGVQKVKSGPPVVFLSIDSTLSENHYFQRIEKARRADLTLVDHDRLDRFKCVAKRVRRLAYCVNDKVFTPGSVRSIDVNYRCGSGASKGHPGGKERVELRQFLAGVCLNKYAYVSGVAPLPVYASDMGRSKVVVNLPRTPINRPHRVFDAMAAGACLLTGKLPNVDGDERTAGVHYHEFDKKKEIPGILEKLFANDEWLFAANAGCLLVTKRHTWAVRAAQLREILREELGL